MSYLMMPAGVPDFSKAVISLWFRVPQESIDAAAKEFERVWNSDPSSQFQYGNGWSCPSGIATYSSKPPQMAGIIPLVIFGRPGLEGSLTYTAVNFGNFTVRYYEWHYTAYPAGEWLLYNTVVEEITDSIAVSGNTWTTEPSYIGIWCTANPKRALLAVNLETMIHAKIAGGVQNLVGHTVMDRSFYSGPTPFPERTWGQTHTYGDAQVYWPRTENFRTHPLVSDIAQYDGTTPASLPFGITVTPDEWHHLLLSFDLSTSCVTHGPPVSGTGDYSSFTSPSQTTSSTPKLWIAYDDVNKTGRDLSYYWPGKGATGSNHDPPQPDKPDNMSVDPNAVLSPAGWRMASIPSGENSTTYTPPDPGFGNEGNLQVVSGIVPASYNCPGAKLPADAIGIPGSKDWVGNIRRVEMAEFQMFTGVTLDTSVEKNRRMFISAKGFPVDPARTDSFTLTLGDPSTWDPAGGGDVPLMASDLNASIGKKGLGVPIVAFTRDRQNWISPLNLGSARGRVTKTGVIKPFDPDAQLGK